MTDKFKEHLKDFSDKTIEAHKQMDLASAESYGQKMQVRAYELEKRNKELLQLIKEMLPFTAFPDKKVGLDQSYKWQEIIERCGDDG